jgi:hypothetical protein
VDFGSVEALVADLIARFGSTQRGVAGKDREKQDSESGM